ncbi:MULTISPECIES: hypothetical protein [Lactiplantibacillus]|uniref:hypothetical protein n=1 Tax=Lactiplantibacillus TaxID=2767842 RepID=UPI0013E8B00E|nr:hypothetical protein [Lactiplantibacillus plantarum]MBU7446391.1 hypothetical protein [Lactiplantibacillus plantarum]MBU7459048.1 hypothetical protein [Lactiplantibacillus plantarum]MBU7466589.1 hypothetical protein [Lactiplantibacillus plantarum]MBU8888741.1 hypothetical protein [Lactiplantibacillus plantarum]MBW2756285.1 hypothetical protein [Lactiplantibacillus plantarum]
MPKHTKKRSTIKRKHRRMKQHAKANKAKTLDSKQLAKEYEPYNASGRLKRSRRTENEH